MRRSTVKIFSLAILLTVGLSGCGGEAPRRKKTESRLEKMKPRSEDSLSRLMDRSWSNFEYIIYGFINYDNAKIKTATENMIAISGYMTKEIPPVHRANKTAWLQQCDTQRELATNLQRYFGEQNFDEARNYFLKLIENCMDCHKVYRKHLMKSEGDEQTE